MLWFLCNLVENYDIRQDPAIQTAAKPDQIIGPKKISLDTGIV